MNFEKYNQQCLLLDISCIDVNEYKNNNEIEELILSCNVQIIKREAFAFCINLKKITIRNPNIKIEQGAFRSCINLCSIELCGISIIESYVFADCVKLRNFQIPYNITHIKAKAFENCVNIIFTFEESNPKQRYKTDNTYRDIIEVMSETLNLDSITICGLFNDFLIETPVYISRISLGNNTMDIVKQFNTRRIFIDYQL
uniref:Leucine-rich repeat protein n=1 Tax=viral metagenome TaxID=1070528 RepID=A0A6C0E461_9ZZZZ